ncbi:MAG: hypothetical protein WDZ76_13745 [Pseudohongiellaceae bacterium]
MNGTSSTAQTPAELYGPLQLQLPIDTLSKGIDNYHIDVKLSKRFRAETNHVSSMLVSQLTAERPKTWDNSGQLDKLRETYLNVMIGLIHRVKTDLKPNEVIFLQFALTKYILKSTRKALDEEISKTKARLADLRSKASSAALEVERRLFELRRNYDALLYMVNRQIFSPLNRAEERQLNTTRGQYLAGEYRELSQACFNPLLYSSDLSAPTLLTNEYSLWSLNADAAAFTEINKKIEALLSGSLRDYPSCALRQDTGNRRGDTEMHDEMGGFFACHPFLGKAIYSQDTISEELCWLDSPDVINRLFNLTDNAAAVSQVRKTSGLAAWWAARRTFGRRKKILRRVVKALRQDKLLNQLLSTYHLRGQVNQAHTEHMDFRKLCQYVSSQIDARKLQESLPSGSQLPAHQLKEFQKLRDAVSRQMGNAGPEEAFRILMDLSRYRNHLKLYRIAHRIFNRISLLEKEEELTLSKEAGTLYYLPASNEIEETGERICHHTILKADVRGSTVITDELVSKSLNPASYFSLRFFDPINKVLDTYGARKVFIEGDAIILSFLEYEHSPEQWFSVSRACGLARELLGIVSVNNRYSVQKGLPTMELGVGICYSPDSPHYLYDEKKPVMISPAIGMADRLSSCSWNLRQIVSSSLFNVEVLKIADGDHSDGEKGQHYIRYNVNGVLLDSAAFDKLQKEIALKRVRLKLNGTDCIFYLGKYPDANGKNKDIAVREGTVGMWKDLRVEENLYSDEKFYEVIVNRKILSLLQELPGQKAAIA